MHYVIDKLYPWRVLQVHGFHSLSFSETLSDIWLGGAPQHSQISLLLNSVDVGQTEVIQSSFSHVLPGAVLIDNGPS